ncbi:MAG: nitroreductase family protein [Candidatus Lokiarchaeota archaeon]|jgi:nitroreductase/NAD-dependent dihydropyrimidine dehydrogenase PreA subunit|nr:nitroreductase family protein [Candidatus Lokiarchaeota archaeon]
MLENSKVIVDIDSCTRCKACANECHYYYFDSDNMHFHEEMEECCIECGKCVAVCPVNVIRLKNHQNETLIDVPAIDELPSFESLSKLFKTRRSRRQFKDKPVPKDIIEKILDVAGRYSATGDNQENVYFTVVQDREILKRLSNECTAQVRNVVEKYEDPQGRESLASVFDPSMMQKIKEVIPSFKRKLKLVESGEEVWRWDAEIIILHSPKDSISLIENCSLAASQIMLAAETLGLGTCSLGYINTFLNQFRSISKGVKLPIKHAAGYTLAIGYPKAHYYRIPARKPLKAKWF